MRIVRFSVDRHSASGFHQVYFRQCNISRMPMLIKTRVVPETFESLSLQSPLLHRIFASRGIVSPQQLDKRLQSLLPYATFTDIEKATLRLAKAVCLDERILVIGDFDADGATSSALAVSALRAMGARHVDFLVPNRFEFGYGLTPGIVGIATQWQPHLIVTVDNGISSIEGVDVANAAGIDVVITDHHLPAETLPKAYAIVNPNQFGDAFPSKSIAGVGVIFYVMLSLLRHLSRENWFVKAGLTPPNITSFLDLVALGTVADLVGLDQNNRILVSQGLSRIRQGQCRVGIRALIEVAGKRCEQLRESDLGFSIAPRLNAAGRLDDMSLGIACLLCDSLEKARALAGELDALNQERRSIEAGMSEQALRALDSLTLHDVFALPIALCLCDPTWHQGVIGILASRLKERYHRPVIAFSVISDSEIKGSARSVAGLNIRDVLAAVDRDNPGLITTFGGHAMAAGLSMPTAAFPAFQQAFVAEVGKQWDVSQAEGAVLSDGALQCEEFTLAQAALLHQAGPWGQQFPEPLFDNVFELLDQRIVGQRHLKLTLQPKEGGEPLSAIAFQVDLKEWPNHRARYVHAAYRLDSNEYQGRTTLQLIIVKMTAILTGLNVQSR